jgi:hypothetical protein
MSRKNPRSVSPGGDSCFLQYPLGHRLRINPETILRLSRFVL